MKEWLSAAALIGGIIIMGLAAVLLNVAVAVAFGHIHIGRLFQ